MEGPKITEDKMFQLLRVSRIDEFNRLKQKGIKGNLKGGNYRGCKMRGLDAEGLDFSDSTFRLTDLRGINFSKTNLRGVSFKGANISGCYFPDEISAYELKLSLEHGTRVRYNNVHPSS